MEIKSKYTSPLILDEILILESNFKRSLNSLEDVKLGLKINRRINQISNDEYSIVLDTTVADDEKVSVFVKCIAKFRTTQENRGLIEKNAIAIMFPYIRSYISIITTQPGMTPIVLPAMNIVAMLNDE